jgi:hypothetical protein
LSFHCPSTKPPTGDKDRRISIKRCRALLREIAPKEDVEVEGLRDRLYAVAEILVDGYVKRRDTSKGSGTDSVSAGLSHSGNELTQDVCITPVLYN